MALNTLRQILEKNGSKYVEKFLNDEVIITEKLDTYRILFENVNGEIKFYKKDNSEINLIERVLTNVWEDAIIELSIILHEANIPEGLRFGLAYTPVERPIRIPYPKLPKYLITDITRRKNNKVIESFSYDELQQWAEILQLGRPPVIFKGKLSEEQKKILLEYAQGNYEDIEENSLSELLQKRLKGTYSDQDIIEGIIISDGERLAQVISYEFEILNEAYQKVEFSRDFYDLTILSLNNFLERYPFPMMEGQNPDEMYLETVCDIFNHYCESPSVTEGMQPEYLTPPSFGYTGGLNLLLIKNKKTLELLEKGGKVYESIFRVILSSLRRYKKEYGLLNESAVNKFNTYVYLISEKIMNPIQESPFEDGAMLAEKSDNIVVNAVARKVQSDVDNMRVIASIQKTFEPKGRQGKPGSEKCAIYLTDFKPFTKSQEENILSIQNMWKVPVIIASVGNSRRVRGEKFFFTDNLVRAQMKAFADSNKHIVPAFFLLKDWDLYSIFDTVRPKYEPIAIITDVTKKSELSLQLYFEEEVMDERISVERILNIGELENKDQLHAFRAIEDMDFSTFKTVTPQPVWGLWDSMQSEWKTWNGKILLK